MRLVLLILLVGIVAWFASARHVAERRRARAEAQAQRWARSHAQPPRHIEHHDRDDDDDDEDSISIAEARRAALEARHEARRAVAEARAEAREALADAARDVREALDQAAQEIREAVDGVPVPIVPGTRVTEAFAEAPAPPIAPRPPAPPAPPAPPKPPAVRHPAAPRHAPAPRAEPSQVRIVEGLISATRERAEREARSELDKQLSDWLEPQGVPRSWKPSPRQVEALILGTTVQAEEKPAPLGTMYTAKLRVDASPGRTAELVQTYRRQVVNRRMAALGGALAFVLICLGVVSGYIRADEATRGYYTNRLRMLAAAGVGAAGAAIYHMVA